MLGTTIIHFISPSLYLALPLFRFTDCHHYKTTFQLFLIICFILTDQIRSVRRNEEFLSHTSLCGSGVPVCFSERIPWGAASLCGHTGLLGTDIGSGNVRCTYFIYWNTYFEHTISPCPRKEQIHFVPNVMCSFMFLSNTKELQEYEPVLYYIFVWLVLIFLF